MQRNGKKICTGKNMEWESPYIPIIVMGLADPSEQCLLGIKFFVKFYKNVKNVDY